MNDEYIDVYPAMVKERLNSIKIEVTPESAGAYSEEFETTGYTQNLYTNGITKAKELWDEVKNIGDEFLKNVLIFPDPEPPQGVIKTQKEGSSVLFRDNPEGNKIGNIKDGDEVEIVRDNGKAIIKTTSSEENAKKWIKVKKSDGTEGYVSYEFLNVNGWNYENEEES